MDILIGKTAGQKESDLGKSFLASQDLKLSSQETYRRALKQFISFLNKQKIVTPKREDILAYKNELIGKGLSSFTVETYLVVVRRFFSWLKEHNLYDNIAIGIKGAKRAKGFRKDTLTVGQIKQVLASVDQSTLQGKRDYAILNLLIRTGLRTIEVVRANVEDIRFGGGEAILFIQGKGKEAKDDFVLLTEETLFPIIKYLAARGQVLDGEPLFAGVSNRNLGRMSTRAIRGLVKTYLKRIGINNRRLTAHSLRHTAITLALLGGASLQETQAMARHSSIQTTMVYAQNINRIESAAERRISALLAG